MNDDMAKNILVFEEPFKDVPIYRVMHVERLIEILILQKLTLRQPKQWDDPFENFMLMSGNRRERSYPADIFGQCWSLHEESDAMWRIYAPEKTGIKIKTSVSNLFSQFWIAPEVSDTSSRSCYIGKVDYFEKDLLKKVAMMNDPGLEKKEPLNGKFIATKLLLKRKEFMHEAEVRLIYLDHFDRGKGMLSPTLSSLVQLSDNQSFQFTVNTETLIEEIMIDPRMSQHTCNAYTYYIRKLGYRGPILQSSLYSLE